MHTKRITVLGTPNIIGHLFYISLEKVKLF